MYNNPQKIFYFSHGFEGKERLSFQMVFVLSGAVEKAISLALLS